MNNYKKLLTVLLSGTADKNIRFNELCNLLKYYNFKFRIKGSHHIYFRDGIEEIINIQPDNSKVKPYQVKQVRNIFLKYKLNKNNEK